MTQARILVVEDESVVALDIQSILRNLGYQIPAIASSGERAVEIAAETRPDLVLMDIKLNGAMDGIEAAQQIRDRLDVPVIYLTAYADEATLQRAKITQPFGYLLKPFEERELHSTVEMALYKHQMDRTIQSRNRELAMLGTAIEQSAESVVITDTQGKIIYVNPAFERITGYTSQEVIGHKPNLLKSGEHEPSFYRELWETITAGQVWHGRFTNRRKDGTRYIADTIITPVRDEKGETLHYVSLQRDVTNEVQLEQQYRQAQKMEALGLLAGGIAHDFNNLLTAVNGFAELMRFQLKPGDPHYDLSEKILNSGRRAAELVSQLLAFSRKQFVKPKILDLNAIVAEMDKMLRRVIGEHVEIESLFAPDLWPVKMDPTQIEQVVVNLAVNARDAMPDGGKLTIETANVVFDEQYAADHIDAQPGEYVMLAIRDTGIGMSEEVQAHIFEPFFTTKEVGKGTGLGLATVHGIVKQSGGYIRVYSEQSRIPGSGGTTFKIYLPRAEGTPIPLTRSDLARNIPGGNETILVVEDHAEVRDLVRRALQPQGYALLEAKDGHEALRLVAEHSGSVDLLLTDVVMPGMNGKTLADEFAIIQPKAKVLFMSGYTEAAIADYGVTDPAIAFLQKPFSPIALARTVRDMLDN